MFATCRSSSFKSKWNKYNSINFTWKDTSIHLLSYWRASETPSGVYKFELVRYMYTCMYVRYSTCATWKEFGTAISNVITTANQALKMEPCAWVCVSIQSSVYGTTTVAKVSLFSTWMRSTIYVRVEIGIVLYLRTNFSI